MLRLNIKIHSSIKQVFAYLIKFKWKFKLIFFHSIDINVLSTEIEIKVSTIQANWIKNISIVRDNINDQLNIKNQIFDGKLNKRIYEKWKKQSQNIKTNIFSEIVYLFIDDLLEANLVNGFLQNGKNIRFQTAFGNGMKMENYKCSKLIFDYNRNNFIKTCKLKWLFLNFISLCWPIFEIFDKQLKTNCDMISSKDQNNYFQWVFILLNKYFSDIRWWKSTNFGMIRETIWMQL